MKGRFRKGKKAAKHLPFTHNPRQQKLAYRYEAWKTDRVTLAMKIIHTLMLQRSARIQMAMIASQPRRLSEPKNVFITLKAVKVAQLTIDTAKAIAKIWNHKKTPVCHEI